MRARTIDDHVLFGPNVYSSSFERRTRIARRALIDGRAVMGMQSVNSVGDSDRLRGADMGRTIAGRTRTGHKQPSRACAITIECARTHLLCAALRSKWAHALAPGGAWWGICGADDVRRAVLCGFRMNRPHMQACALRVEVRSRAA